MLECAELVLKGKLMVMSHAEMEGITDTVWCGKALIVRNM